MGPEISECEKGSRGHREGRRPPQAAPHELAETVPCWARSFFALRDNEKVVNDFLRIGQITINWGQ